MELVAYYRVSTARQGDSGLEIEAQLVKVQQMAAERGAVVAVAKIDRLARDAEFVLRLAREAERHGMAGFLFCDLPDIDATTSVGRMVLTMMASVAEFDARRASERTRDALAAAKTRGVKLGGLRLTTLRRTDAARDRATAEAEKLRGVLAPMAAAGMSLRTMSAALAGAGKVTRKGAPLAAVQVARLLDRLELRAA